MRVVVWAALAVLASTYAQAKDTRLMLSMPDSLAPGAMPGMLSWSVPGPRVPGGYGVSADSTGLSPLTLGFHRAIAPRRYTINTFQHISEGAGKGANLGLALGYIGTLFGKWDDETALYMMAAGAALWGHHPKLDHFRTLQCAIAHGSVEP